jgi:hypothetical protein
VVTLVFLCRRRPDLTHARYAELLLGGHVPLALRHHPTLRGYVVNVVEAAPPGAPGLDSIGALTFDHLEDFHRRLYDSPEGERIIARDVARFMGGADAYVTTTHVQRDELPPAVPGTRSAGTKLVCPIVRRAGLDHEAFVAHWLERHVPLALAHHPRLRRYVTRVVDRRLSPGGADLDGIAELHLADDGGLFASADGERIIREDMARFIGWTAGYRVAEWVQRRAPG